MSVYVACTACKHGTPTMVLRAFAEYPKTNWPKTYWWSAHIAVAGACVGGHITGVEHDVQSVVMHSVQCSCACLCFLIFCCSQSVYV
jgi:hypothetical protein